MWEAGACALLGAWGHLHAALASLTHPAFCMRRYETMMILNSTLSDEER